MNDLQIAEVAHEVNRAYCQALHDESQAAWEDAPAWQRESTLKGVQFYRENPDAGPAHGHEEWLKEKEAAGWKYGQEKSEASKEHPCMLPFTALPTKQQAKDFIFRGVVRALLTADESLTESK